MFFINEGIACIHMPPKRRELHSLPAMALVWGSLLPTIARTLAPECLSQCQFLAEGSKVVPGFVSTRSSCDLPSLCHGKGNYPNCL